MNKRIAALGLAMMLALLLPLCAVAEEEAVVLRVVSCTLSEEEVGQAEFLNFTYSLAFDDEQAACGHVLEALRERSADVDVYFVSTADPDYAALLASGECTLLDGASYLWDAVGQMPADLSELCFHEGSLYAVPVGFLPLGEGDDPAVRTPVVAVINPHSAYLGKAAALLDQYLLNLPASVQSLLWPEG